MHKASLWFRAQLGYCWAQQDWGAGAAALKKRLLLPLGKGAAADLQTQWELAVGAGLSFPRQAKAPGSWVLLISEIFKGSETHVLVAQLSQDFYALATAPQGSNNSPICTARVCSFLWAKTGLQLLLCHCPSLPAVNSAGNALVVLRRGRKSPRVLGLHCTEIGVNLQLW